MARTRKVNVAKPAQRYSVNNTPTPSGPAVLITIGAVAARSLRVSVAAAGDIAFGYNFERTPQRRAAFDAATARRRAQWAAKQ